MFIEAHTPTLCPKHSSLVRLTHVHSEAMYVYCTIFQQNYIACELLIITEQLHTEVSLQVNGPFAL
jgi:hypothetical protein